ncbi:molybdenum cofactor biosynthesis protein MoaA [Campylobacter fetus subsp. testudinum]|uniref:molybdopterin molybdotransferase MoeA n=1 Tax=Campylobacter fetus TaxID=196 RepID=UPI0008189B27|nr:molybdopterin molybdotransferase MoeA [Campylobacter fetus]OCR96275.1 molybdenum cofactor biosynthesis protein MoaA [Campylobacter fetus subsp. testudinum]OCR99132.1 molybdenum cofactor biosynthesis protein MoaA [Campylobacter fetus subsp. testudinum]
MKSYNDSLKDLLSSAPTWDRVERVALSAALGRVVCYDIAAKNDYPEFETSAMDGYAIKFSDMNLKKLKIIGCLPAGVKGENISIKSAECVKTFTGAIICDGADTLIPIENVTANKDYIDINTQVKKGFAIRKIGESYKKGDILIKKGTKLSYSELGLLAELGISYVNVFVRPKVAVLSTGSEIVDIGEIPTNSAQIHSSNHIAIANMLWLMNCEVVTLPVIKDDINLIKQTIKSTLKSCDFLITTGGVSVGDFDFIRDIMGDFELVVNKAAIKPGRHVKVAKLGEKYIFALPGFPYSAMVTCALYFREFINKILCLQENYRFKAILDEQYIKKSDFEEFSAASIENENGIIKISTSTKKSGSSAIVSNLNNKAVLLNCPLEREKLEKGEVVEYIIML